jgi:hypothetical protein
VDSLQERKLKESYLRKAICEYEYSSAPEYDNSRMSSQATAEGTVDIDPEADVEICKDGAWVSARVWVPKEWL